MEGDAARRTQKDEGQKSGNAMRSSAETWWERRAMLQPSLVPRLTSLVSIAPGGLEPPLPDPKTGVLTIGRGGSDRKLVTLEHLTEVAMAYGSSRTGARLSARAGNRPVPPLVAESVGAARTLCDAPRRRVSAGEHPSARAPERA